MTVIRAMHTHTSTMVKLNGKMSSVFGVTVGVHQSSVLNTSIFTKHLLHPQLFITVLGALSKKF